MRRRPNHPDIDLELFESRYGFANVQSETYILLELPVQLFGKYIAKAMAADCPADNKSATVFLVWDCMDDFEAGKEPSQVKKQIQ